MSDGKLHRTRIRILIGVVALVGALVIVRLFSLQIINRNFYTEKAEHQYVTPAGGVFDRGNIYFTDKDGTTVAAASVVNGFKVAIVPAQIENVEHAYGLINEIVPIDHDEFVSKAAKKKDPYEEIADRVTEDKARAITALEIPGVTLYRDKWRTYPGGNLAAKAIGFVSYRGDSLVGNYGLEEYYNSTLSRSSAGSYVNFFAEIFANVQSSIFKNTAVNGDVVTSIEPTVQAQLEHEVAQVERQWGSDSVGGIVMDPYTGEIIAMAQVPSFDLNEYGKVKNVGIFSNPFAQNVYEMGSIVKPLVMAAAIDAGAVTPTTSYFDSGKVTINGATLNNFDKKGRGQVNMQDVLNQSLNTGMIFVEQHLGKDKFKDYMVNKYRLGEKTGIDLPGEVNGRMGSLNGANDINYAAASFGQGIATSPINIVRGFGVLANGGTLITPHIATAVIEGDGSLKPFEYKHSDPVLKPETISTIRNMLVHVVDDGYHQGLDHYSVAAKTGTAQIAKSDGTGYYTDRNLHSLIGFFPATKPRYVVYFFNVYPKGALFAIQTLADPFFGTVQFLANYYHIPPDR
jgi:cell division protein FtsI/penicillin-binding protein 2